MSPDPRPPNPPDPPEQAAPLDSGWPRALSTMARLFPRHLAFASVLGLVLLISNFLVRGGWWTFWPMLILAVLVGLHYLLYKAATADDAWASARAKELNIKSYDRGHIDSIAERHR